MQNKGAIKLFAILLVLVCIYHLSFTFITKSVEKKAVAFSSRPDVIKNAKKLANGDIIKEKFIVDSLIKARENYYLDSMSNQVVYNILVRKFTYKECKEREINLGLDLKGGMNVTLEVSIPDIIRSLSKNSLDPSFNKAIRTAQEMEKNSQTDFVTLFGKAFKQVAQPGEKLAAIFSSGLKDKITFNSSDEDVLKVLRTETSQAVDLAYQILRTRIDQFGVSQPNIQKSQINGRILVELPGVKDPTRVRKLLQGTAKLEFWTTYEYSDVSQYFIDADKKLKALLSNKKDTSNLSNDSLAENLKSSTDSSLANNDSNKLKSKKGSQSADQYAKDNPLSRYLIPNYEQVEKGQYRPRRGAVVGMCDVKDTSRVNRMLSRIKGVFPKNLKLCWSVKPASDKGSFLELYALKPIGSDGSPALDGDVIADARQDVGQNGEVEVSMRMTSKGARDWKKITAANVGKQVAIVLDNYVYSCPNVREEIPNGQSQISGHFSIDEAKDLANVLGAGKLPAQVKIVEENVVGPSLGKKAIDAGQISFLVAIIIILVFMSWYYNRAGMVASIALFANLFFLFGVLASLQAVITLPGIAGIVLVIGMAVDANVIIYERIKEELRAGKGIRLAVADGYKHSYSAIIDGQMTTIITGIVLYIFGSGPVRGFATTLVIGILTSLFAAIFISRMIFIWMMDKNIEIPFYNKITSKWFTNVHIKFIENRKYFYSLSIIVMLIGAISLMTRGLHQGIDFAGGRTYTVRFDQDVKTNELGTELTKHFDGLVPEVKTFGSNDQVKITTNYLIDDETPKTDSIVEKRLYEGVKGFYKKQISLNEFLSDKDNKIEGRLSSQKVGPTIADDIRKQAVWAVLISLIIIFLYIAARFRRWTFGLGGIIALAHDAFITVSMYSIFYNLVPFDLQIDQSFIAAVLTIIGYSINDSVIIFDRIREYLKIHPKRSMIENMNEAMNSTLGRTFNTVLTVVLVLFVLFIFGGEFIRGFTFVLLVGVAFGSYSSIFISAALAYDIIQYNEKRKAKKIK